MSPRTGLGKIEKCSHQNPSDFISPDFPRTISDTGLSKEVANDGEWGNPWPQQDNSVQEAIRNGLRLDIDQTPSNSSTHYMWNGTRCESPPQGLATVVSAYYEMPSKHSFQQYMGWIKIFLKATDPLVIFVDPDPDPSTHINWGKIVEERQHAPTLIVPMPFNNLTAGTVLSDQFWKTYIFPRDKESRFKKGVDVYKIWNQKYVFMREVARENPFQTEFFYWIDAGYYRSYKRTTPIYSPIVRNNITENGVNPEHQLVYQLVHPVPKNPKPYDIAGGAWGGTARAINVHYEHYWKTFWYLTLYSNKECVGYEQTTQVWMCRSFPSLCVMRKSSDWFEMGRRWLRNPQFNFLPSETVPIDNTASLPPLSENTNVTFPKDSVIGLIEGIPKGQLSLGHQPSYPARRPSRQQGYN